jgi:hypothetical protein
MSSRNLARRLERLEAELTPSNEQVMTITVTRIGDRNTPTTTKTIEVYFRRFNQGRRRWYRNGGSAQ